jgi:transposase-like protein
MEVTPSLQKRIAHLVAGQHANISATRLHHGLITHSSLAPSRRQALRGALQGISEAMNNTAFGLSSPFDCKIAQLLLNGVRSTMIEEVDSNPSSREPASRKNAARPTRWTSSRSDPEAGSGSGPGPQGLRDIGEETRPSQLSTEVALRVAEDVERWPSTSPRVKLRPREPEEMASSSSSPTSNHVNLIMFMLRA